MSSSLGRLALLFVPFTAIAACGSFRDECHTATGPFSAKYTLQDSPGGTCDPATVTELQGLKGDILGFEWYEFDHYNRDPDRDVNTLAVQANALGKIVAMYSARKTADGQPARDTAHKPYALGAFATPGPEADFFCRAPVLVSAEQNLPAVPSVPADASKMGDKGLPPLPAVSIKYDWTDVRVFVDPVISGAEIAATLAYTKNGCTAHYRVVAVYPQVNCLDTNKAPSPVMCDPVPRPEQNHPVGSGLSFPTTCDPDLGFCVLAKDDIP